MRCHPSFSQFPGNRLSQSGTAFVFSDTLESVNALPAATSICLRFQRAAHKPIQLPHTVPAHTLPGSLDCESNLLALFKAFVILN